MLKLAFKTIAISMLSATLAFADDLPLELSVQDIEKRCSDFWDNTEVKNNLFGATNESMRISCVENNIQAHKSLISYLSNETRSTPTITAVRRNCFAEKSASVTKREYNVVWGCFKNEIPKFAPIDAKLVEAASNRTAVQILSICTIQNRTDVQRIKICANDYALKSGLPEFFE